MGLIIAMWIFTLAYFSFLTDKSIGGDIGASICGFTSFVLSIYLLTRRNGTDRTNGVIRMGISVVMGLIAFSKALDRH